MAEHQRLLPAVQTRQDAPQSEVDDRIALLAGLLDGGDEQRRHLALDACDAALNSVNYVQADCRKGGTGPTVTFGPPKGTQLDPYRGFLRMLLERVGCMEQDEGRRAAGILAKRAVELSSLDEMLDEAIESVRTLCERRPEDGAAQTRAVVAALYKLPVNIGGERAATWRALAASMGGSGERSA